MNLQQPRTQAIVDCLTLLQQQRSQQAERGMKLCDVCGEVHEANITSFIASCNGLLLIGLLLIAGHQVVRRARIAALDLNGALTNHCAFEME